MEERIYVYKQTEDYVASVQEAGGFILFHLEVSNWTPGVFRELKVLFDEACEKFLADGHELVFSSTYSEKTVKMANMVRPTYDVKTLDHYGTTVYVIAWETEKGN